MSIVITRSVFCDARTPHGTCANWTVNSTELAPVARRIAAAEDWTRRGGEDLCPDHSKGGGDRG